MDAIAVIGIVAIIIGYLNLFLLLKKDKPVVNIYNQIPLSKYDVASGTASDKYAVTTEVPIDSTFTIKDINGDISLDSEKISTSNVSELTEKIKNIRSK